MINFLNYLNECDNKTIGGIGKLYFKERKEIDRWFYEKTAQLQQGIILGQSGNDNHWHLLLYDLKTAIFTQTELFIPSRNYDMTLKIQINKMSVYNRDKMEQLSVIKDIVALYEDNNGNWWLMGETFGCRGTHSTSTDVDNGNNIYELTLSCKERYPIRNMSQDYIDNYVEVPIINFCSQSWDTICNSSWQEICNMTFS